MFFAKNGIFLKGNICLMWNEAEYLYIFLYSCKIVKNSYYFYNNK